MLFPPCSTNKPGLPRPKKRPASAIIVALAVIALVSVVTLTMSSLSQLNERTSVVRKESVLARKNALLGLKVAVGQIQENLGVDQAITLNARHYNRHDADATNDTKDYAQPWTAALSSKSTFKWESPNEDPVWLVSGNGIASTSNTKPDTDLESLPHAELGVTYTDRITAIPVKAPLRNVSVHAANDKPTGRYAYWVDDEGMKARVNYFDLGVHADRTDGNTRLNWPLTSTPKTGIEILNIPSPPDTEVPTLNDGTGRHDYQKGLIGNILKGSDDEENGDEIHPFASFFFPWSDIIDEGSSAYDERWPLDLNKLHSARAFETWLGVENIYQLRETLTFNSYGVFSDTKDGGLRRGLSSVLGREHTLPTGAEPGTDEIGENIRIFQAGGTISDKNPGGPKWGQFADGIRERFPAPLDPYTPYTHYYRPWTDLQHGYTFGIWLQSFILSVKIDAWEDGDPDAPDADGKIFQNYKYKLITEYKAHGNHKIGLVARHPPIDGRQPYLNLSGPWDSASNSYHKDSHDLILKPLVKTESGAHDFFDGRTDTLNLSTINLFDVRPKDWDGNLIDAGEGLNVPWSSIRYNNNWREPENKFETEWSLRDFKRQGDPWRIDFKETNTDPNSTFTLRVWQNKAAFDTQATPTPVPPTLIVEGLSRKAYPYLVGNDHAGLNRTAADREIDKDSAEFKSSSGAPTTLYSYYWGLPVFWTAYLGQPQLGSPTPYTSRWNAFGPYILADPQAGRNLIYQGGLFSRSALRQWVGSLPPVGNHPASLAVADEAEDTTASPNLDRRVAAYDSHWLWEYRSTRLYNFHRMRFPQAKLNYPSKANEITSVYDRMLGGDANWGTSQLGPSLGNGAELQKVSFVFLGSSLFNGINIASQFNWLQLRPGRISRYPHESIPTSPIGNSWLPAWFGLDSSSDGLPDRETNWATALSKTEYTEPAIINGHERGFTHYDWCYKLNEALWDRYFLNKRTHFYYNPYHRLTLPSNRFTFLNEEEDSYEKSAANVLNTWVLNVNTPHEDGWKNLIGARWNHLDRSAHHMYAEADLSRASVDWILHFNLDGNYKGVLGGTPSGRARKLAKSGYFNADDNYTIELNRSWGTAKGFSYAYSPADTDLRREQHQGRALLLNFGGIRINLRHANSIARILTEQVAVRGPYKSLGQFINRDKDATGAGIENRRRQIEGVLQYAIDESGANDFLLAAEDGVALPGLATFTGALNGANMNALDTYWRAGHKLDLFNEADPTDQDHNTTYRTYYIFHGKKMPYKAGAHPHVSQAKLLEGIGHIISPRSDTFTIHFYGESTNPITGEAVATAQGRAVVQRLPEFIDASDDAWTWNRTNNSDDAPNTVNIRFGRRFIITSLQWD